MDLKEQVARRRQALAADERLAKDAAASVQAEHAAAAARETQANLVAAGVPVVASANGLRLAPTPAPVPDVAGMKRAQIMKLVRHEARRRWTPKDNWLVISTIAAGIALIYVAGLGLLLVVIGLARRAVLQRDYSQQVLDDYPPLKAALDAA